jgi:hypothetical protein
VFIVTINSTYRFQVIVNTLDFHCNCYSIPHLQLPYTATGFLSVCRSRSRSVTRVAALTVTGGINLRRVANMGPYPRPLMTESQGGMKSGDGGGQFCNRPSTSCSTTACRLHLLHVSLGRIIQRADRQLHHATGWWKTGTGNSPSPCRVDSHPTINWVSSIDYPGSVT